MNVPRYNRLDHRLLRELSTTPWLSLLALARAAARESGFKQDIVASALTSLRDCGAVTMVLTEAGERRFSLTEVGRALLAEWERSAPKPVTRVFYRLTANTPLPAVLLDDPRLVPVWYGTNRRPENAVDEHDGYGGATDNRMHYGYCTVKVPKRYVKGGSGRGWLRRLIHREQTELELDSITPLAEAEFWSRLASTLGVLKAAPAMLLFVHGFRTTFRAAVEGAGQLSYELDLPVALFSWASRGKLAGYLADEEAARESVGALKDFVRTLASTAAAQGRRLHVIAHSMGNRALLQALHEVALQGAAAGPQLGQVIFAAPDVPQREFLRQLAQVVAAPGLTTGHTLYAAKDDLALFASRELHDNPRAGICPPVTTAPQLETVDVSRYNLSTLGHGYCFNVGPVLEDISVVLHGGKFRLRSRAVGGHWILG